MEKKKMLVMCTLLMAIILLSVGTIAYFRRIVNGNITGQAGTLVFNVNGLTGETSETLEFSLNRSADEPFVMPDDSGYFDLEITAEGSSTDVYVAIDISRDNLPDNLKFYVDEDYNSVITKRYIFFEKTGDMSETMRIYWFWDGSKDDINDSLFINEELSARITLTAVPMEYGMMKNGIFEALSTGVFSGLAQPQYFTAVREITFTKDFSGMPEECTEENLCFDISYEENQKYPVYAYLVETDETGNITDAEFNETTGNLYDMFIVCSKTVFAPVDSSGLFASFMNLRNINFNNWFNTSLTTNMNAMFGNGDSLTSLDLSSFNTSSVTDMNNMFNICSNLTILNLESFDTSGVTNMSQMFYECSKLTSLELSSFNTSSVTGMNDMFQGCSSLTNLDLSSFDTSSVTDMNNMFQFCSSLTNLDLSSFDTSSVTNMSQMFYECSKLTSLELSSFNTSSVTNMDSMFYGCSNLVTIYVSGLWNVDAVTSSTAMFVRCSKLTGGNGTLYNISHSDKTYAKIDEEGRPGYLTYKA